MAGGLDWPGLMRAGIGGLGLEPDRFWALTPAELALMLGLSGAEAEPMDRNRLAAMAAAWPDQVTRETIDVGS
ncbi:rcc01693 family protein [Paracoccus sp. p4-l81]|uniref:rcc01693 family protein n=1 Tax=Paracoccus sp. p4-l81 TaxID=3342806 RepID=UPI0035BB3D2C